MNYTITLRDKTEIILNQDEGVRLKEYWLGLKTARPIDIKGQAYLSNQIVSITQMAGPMSAQSANALPPPKKPLYNCGANSVYYQVIMYAKGHKEIKKLKDQNYTNKVRSALLTKYSNKFCDHKNDYHVCKENDRPIPESIQSIFLGAQEIKA